VKVLLLADSLGNGGLERQLALLATSLPAQWECRVWAMGGGEFETYLRAEGIDVTVCERRFRYDPLPAVALFRELRSWRPDVVHSWSWMAALAAGTLCRILCVPSIDGMIQSGARERDPLHLKRLGMALATIVVANSRAGLESWGIGSRKGRVVHNGFDQSRLPGTATVASPDDSHFTVIMTGRMVPVKHFDLVLEAARSLNRESDGWRFVLVGDGHDRARLEREAHDLVQAGIVDFPEPGREVLPLVDRSDVGVLMTNPQWAVEGLANSIMEYMALGLPVVCSDGGGNRELVVDGITGFVVPPADSQSLARRLQYLRTHDERRRAMGAAGRARILSEFSLQSMVNAMLDVYAEAMARRNGWHGLHVLRSPIARRPIGAIRRLWVRPHRASLRVDLDNLRRWLQK
jgi:glycosyltransferase involved in cell wall biosynthesis